MMPARRLKISLTRREAIARARRSSKFRSWGSTRIPKGAILVEIIRRSTSPSSRDSIAEEKHYTPAEVGKIWALSVETVRRLFENEPGVLKMPNASGPSGRRRYKTLRIPASIVARVHRKISA